MAATFRTTGPNISANVFSAFPEIMRKFIPKKEKKRSRSRIIMMLFRLLNIFSPELSANAGGAGADGFSI